MAYLGEHLRHCRAVPFDWEFTYVVIVSGTGPNVCGHAVLKAGNFYFHVAGLNDYPRYMNQNGYERYLRENGKEELRRTRVTLSNPQAAQVKMEELSAKRWRWMILPNNCASYVEDIIAAGGASYLSLTNCPVLGWQ